jgi:hypothetical protein
MFEGAEDTGDEALTTEEATEAEPTLIVRIAKGAVSPSSCESPDMKLNALYPVVHGADWLGGLISGSVTAGALSGLGIMKLKPDSAGAATDSVAGATAGGVVSCKKENPLSVAGGAGSGTSGAGAGAFKKEKPLPAGA